MNKNIQVKIILIFFILGIVIIAGLGIGYLNMLKELEALSSNPSNVELLEAINLQITQTKAIIAIFAGVYAIISVLMGFFVSKSLVSPMKKLIKSAEKIASGENIEIETTTETASEVGDLTNAFNIMTLELKQKFNEVNRQKKQIETILLHMTDGIIAFDIEGKIIHINPAAKTLLGLDDKDDTFEKIFKKLKIDINMEKIIYLENWTSSEQRKNVGEKCINILFAPFQDENDRPAGIVVVIQDITEHVKLDNMRKEFVADVSHELKTPITSIMGYADTLLEGEYDKETQTKFLSVISAEGKRMARLVTDLLTLSRYDNKKIKLE